MRSVGVKELRDHLSEYVRIASGGEVVLVTDRDRVVAELVPTQPGRANVASDALLAELVRSGVASVPISRHSAPPPRFGVAPVAELLAELAADRDGR